MAAGGSTLERSLARGIAVFRWLSLIWASAGLLLEREQLVHPWLATGALFVAGSFTILMTTVIAAGESDRRKPFAAGLIAAELAIGAALLVLDGVVFSATREQSLPWSWPAAGIMSAAVVGGVRVGVAAAAWIAVASFVGEALLRDGTEVGTSTLSKSALYVLAGAAAAVVAQRLREAESLVSAARVREEIARVLHDGVLQTLAAVERRSDDDSLRDLARVQERELRSYLFGQQRQFVGSAVSLRAAIDDVAQRHQAHVRALIAADLPELAQPPTQAMIGAVGEAVTNALKHAGATEVVVLAEPDEDGEHRAVIVVRDNGVGFDPASTLAGVGISRSIRARVEEAGGRVRIITAPGKGTEVWIWMS